MTAQGWESPERLKTVPVIGAHELRPLSTGEVLDRTFAIYREHFWLFAGLASLAGACSLALNALQMLVKHLVLLQRGMQIAGVVTEISSVGVLLLLVPVTAVVYAASVYALGEVYLGRGVTAKEALEATAGRWLRYVGIGMWQGWSAGWLLLAVLIPGVFLVALGGRAPGMAIVGGLLVFVAVIGGGVYGVIAYIRNSLGIPVSVMEGMGVRASMRRSKTLATGTKGRIFVVMLIAWALYLVFGAMEAPMLFFIARSPLQEHVLAQAAILLLAFAAQTVVVPVMLIGLTLVYFDQRVRLEAFDLVMMMSGTAPEPVAAWGSAAVGVAAETPVVEAQAASLASLETGADGGEALGSDGHV